MMGRLFGEKFSLFHREYFFYLIILCNLKPKIAYSTLWIPAYYLGSKFIPYKSKFVNTA